MGGEDSALTSNGCRVMWLQLAETCEGLAPCGRAESVHQKAVKQELRKA